MRRSTLGLPLALVLLLSGCITPVSLERAPASGPANVPAPEVKVGDRWSFNLVNGYNSEVVTREDVEVIGRTADRISVRRSDPKKGIVSDEQFTPAWNWISNARPRMSALEYSPAFNALPFPLEIGRTWQSDVVAIDPATGARFPVRIWGRVVGWERIRVPAGELDTVKVVRTVYHMDGRYDRGNTRIDEAEWYAPAVGHSVRYENTSGYPNYASGRRSAWVRGDWNVLELVAPVQSRVKNGP